MYYNECIRRSVVAREQPPLRPLEMLDGLQIYMLRDRSHLFHSMLRGDLVGQYFNNKEYENKILRHMAK